MKSRILIVGIILTFSFKIIAMTQEKQEVVHQGVGREQILTRCPICFEIKDEAEICKLSCGHAFCRACLVHMIDVAAQDRKIAQLRCPDQTCKALLTLDDITHVVQDAKKFEMILDAQAQEWIAQQPGAKHCPTPDCQYMFLVDDGCPQVITCPNCHRRYCSHCLLPHVVGVTCREAAASRVSDAASDALLMRTTKPCPRCGTRIEKQGGCDFVRCSRCGLGFCYVCGGSHHVANCQNAPMNTAGPATVDPYVAEQAARGRSGTSQVPVRPEARLVRPAQLPAVAIQPALAPVVPALDPLRQAIWANSAIGIRQAIMGGSDINLEKDGISPILLAILLKRYEALEALLDAHADVNVKVATEVLIPRAMALGDFRPIFLLITKGGLDSHVSVADPNNAGYHVTLLTAALRLGDIRSAIYLVPRVDGFSGRDRANRWGETIIDDIFRLFDARVGGGEIPLEQILDLLQEIVNHGYVVNNIWYWGLHGNRENKLIYQRPQILEFFLRNGADPNHVMNINEPAAISGGPWTWTPLLRAIDAGSLPAVEILLNAGADINKEANPISGKAAFTSLTFALEKGNGEIVEYLLRRGAKLVTPLQRDERPHAPSGPFPFYM